MSPAEGRRIEGGRAATAALQPNYGTGCACLPLQVVRAAPDFSLPELIRKELGLRRSLASWLSSPLCGPFGSADLSLQQYIV